jgi:hypothetical protein
LHVSVCVYADRVHCRNERKGTVDYTHDGSGGNHKNCLSAMAKTTLSVDGFRTMSPE